MSLKVDEHYRTKSLIKTEPKKQSLLKRIYCAVRMSAFLVCVRARVCVCVNVCVCVCFYICITIGIQPVNPHRLS